MPPSLHKILFVLLALGCATFLPAQVKDGYKKLKKKDYAGAEAAFKNVAVNAPDSLEATWGLAQALGLRTPPAYDSSWTLAAKAQTMLRKVKGESARKKLEKKYGLSSALVNQFTREIPANRWKEIDGNGDLRIYDRFLELYDKKINARTKKTAVQQQRKSLFELMAAAKTYDDLGYLFKKHGKFTRDSFPSRHRDIEKALFPAFVEENGLPAARQFFSEHPTHPFSQETSRIGLLSAIDANKTTQYVQFISKHPESPFTPFVLKHIERLNASGAQPAEQELNALSPDDRAMYEDILSGQSSGVFVNCYSTFDGKGVAQWKKYMQRHAGDDCGQKAMHEVVRYAIKERDWTPASEVLKEMGPLFPKDSNWVRRMSSMINSPDNGERPVSAGKNINTRSGREYLPALTRDGRWLAFCGRARADNLSGEDIYISEWKDSAWTPAKLVRELCNDMHQAPLSFSGDGNTMIIFENGEAFTSDRTATGWGTKKKFPVDMSEFSWVCDVQYAQGGQVVFFAGNATGDIDIFMAVKDENGVWSKPKALNAPVNSDRTDRSPFLHPDMQTLYFSSERDEGFGQLDVYKCVRLDDTWLNWSEPVNLGKNVNTDGRDWGYFITTDGATAWFAADEGMEGNSDIFSLKLPKEARPEKLVREVKLDFRGPDGKALGDTPIEVRNTQSGKVIGQYRTPPGSGRVTLLVPEGEKVTVSPKKAGIYGKPVAIDLTKPMPDSTLDKPIRIDVKLTKDLGGTKTELNADILFNLGESTLRSDATAQIRFLADFLKQEKMLVSLYGHTDPSGTDEDNLKLSQARAEAVKQALVEQGVDSSKITAVGKGESELKCNINSPECNQSNRRVEIVWFK